MLSPCGRTEGTPVNDGHVVLGISDIIRFIYNFINNKVSVYSFISKDIAVRYIYWLLDSFISFIVTFIGSVSRIPRLLHRMCVIEPKRKTLLLFREKIFIRVHLCSCGSTYYGN